MSRVKFALFPLRVLAYPMRDVIVAALVVGTVAVAASVMVDSILLAPRGALYSDLLAGSCEHIRLLWNEEPQQENESSSSNEASGRGCQSSRSECIVRTGVFISSLH